jgi:hypothetical protein
MLVWNSYATGHPDFARTAERRRSISTATKNGGIDDHAREMRRANDLLQEARRSP